MTQAFNLSQLANYVNSSGQLDASTGLTNTSTLSFPSGTLMLFQQTAAPTGWTKQTTHNNKALRVVSGTASSGGTTAFTTVFSNQSPTISATTLSSSQLPSHQHISGDGLMQGFSLARYGGVDTGINAATAGYVGVNTSGAYTSLIGSGDSHSHSAGAITLNVQYVDLIIASKN